MTAANLSPDLDAIQARVDAATEGPWHVDEAEQTVRAREYAGEIVYDRSAEHPSEWAVFRPTANFIAHARTDVPALLALVREQQAAIERVRELHAPIPSDDERVIGPVCSECSQPDDGMYAFHPCETIDALTATEGA